MQNQGSSSSTGGRLDASCVNNLLAAANIALGAGWGTTASVAIAAGSNDQAGTLTVTSAGTGQAQATANVAITFADGAYAAVPRAVNVTLQKSSNAANEPQPTEQTATATGLSFRAGALPVAAATYRYSWVVVA